MSQDKMSQDKLSHGQNVTGQNVTRIKCHRTKCYAYKMSHRQNGTRTKCHTDKIMRPEGCRILTSNYAVNYHIVRNTNRKPSYRELAIVLCNAI